MAAGSTTFHKNDGTGIYTVDSFIGFPTVESLGWSRDRYTFVSWNTSADGTGASFAEGSSDPNPDETGYGVYYAIWKYVPTYLDFDGLSTYDGLIKAEISGKIDVGGKAGGIPYGSVDSTSTSTVFTATVDGLTELYDGACVMLHNGVVTSAKNFTINVNGLGAKKCYSNMSNATQETTIFNVAYTMLFVYSTALDSGNGGWWLYRGYNSDNNTIGYQLRTNATVRNVSDTARYYKIYFTSADGTTWVPSSVNSTNNATSARPVNQRPIDPFGRIVYTSSSASYAAGANLAATTIWDQYTFTLGYSFNRTGEALDLTAERPVYVKCAPQADGSAIMDADEPIVQQLPTTKDGKIYICLGIAYNAINIELVPHHPVYWHDGTGIRLWTGAEPSGGDVSMTEEEVDEAVESAFNHSIINNAGNIASVDKSTAFAGETVTVTITTISGTAVSVIVTDANGLTVATWSNVGTYSFTMPASDVEISSGTNSGGEN